MKTLTCRSKYQFFQKKRQNFEKLGKTDTNFTLFLPKSNIFLLLDCNGPV